MTVESGPADTSCALTWTVRDAVGRELSWPQDAQVFPRSTIDTTWDGLLADGLPADPGPVRVFAGVACDGLPPIDMSATVWIARLGVVEVSFAERPDDGGLVRLAYHKLDAFERGITVLDEKIPSYRNGAGTPFDLADLDLDGGAARPSLAPWAIPDYPPWGHADPGEGNHNVPAAYVVGARARVIATPGTTAVSVRGGTAIGALGPAEVASSAPRLRLVADELTPVDAEATLVPGAPLSFDANVLTPSLGRVDVSFAWRFQSELGGQWVDVPGHAITTHRIYGLAGPPALRDGTTLGAAPPFPWIGVLEDLNGAVSGLDADPAAVLGAVRAYIHQNHYLLYDPGDAAYTDFTGEYIFWDYISIDLAAWLDRGDGIALYCHSLSCLLSSLAGNVGVDAPQYVLGVGFTTNYVHAAGTASDDWRTWGFNSHSVVSPDGGATIWDASIQLDGDDDPASYPSIPLDPAGLPASEYLNRLTYDAIEIVNQGGCYIL